MIQSFTKKPSKDGTLPDAAMLDDGTALNLLSDTSEEEEEVIVEESVPEKAATPLPDDKTLDPAELEALK